MIRLPRTLPAYVTCLALALGGSAAVRAQTVNVQQGSGYTRLNFAFESPAKLQVGGGGQNVILTFDQPVSNAQAQLKARLGSMATGVQQSADGTQIVLNLDKNYRVRQFVSSNGVGIDILQSALPTAEEAPPKPPVAAPAVPAAATAPAAPATPLKATPSTTVPVLRPPEKPAEKPLPQPAKKPAEKPTTVEPTKDTPPEAKVIRVAPPSILSTKPAAKEPPPQPEAVAAAAAPEGKPASQPAPLPEPDEAVAPAEALGEVPSPMLTTKEPAVPPEAKADAKQPTPEPAPAPAEPTMKAEAKKPDVLQPATEVAEQPEAAPAAAPQPLEPDAPFVVGVTSTRDGAVMDFPFRERTAAAVFERGNNIWLVFSRPQEMNASLLRTVLPRSVIAVDQFDYPDASVLRLTTDGSLHASIDQPENSYRWQLTLGPSGAPATQDITVQGDRDVEGNPYLLLSVFDVSTPVQFYDPMIGDYLVIVPTYERGRGIIKERTTPDMHILPTQQGVAVASLRDRLHTRTDRTGVKIFGPAGLAISSDLPTSDAAIAPVRATSSVLLPYEQWAVPTEDFIATYDARVRDAVEAESAERAEALEKLMQMHLAAGLGSEALGYLQLIRTEEPDYFVAKKLALATAAAHFLEGRYANAAAAIQVPELADVKEATLWKQAIGRMAPASISRVSTPEAENDAPAVMPAQPANTATEDTTGLITGTPAAPPMPEVFDYLGYHRYYIRAYPPRIRQKLALVAAANYMEDGDPQRAIATFDTLNSDGILLPVQPYAELMIGRIAADKGRSDDALRVWDRLARDFAHRDVQVQARFEAAMLRYVDKKADTKQTIAELEKIRLSWRGDALERIVLLKLADLYYELGQYDQTLRSWRNLLQNFPGDPETLGITGKMSDLFQELFLDGKADSMPAMKSLGLFYEFRELTPIGRNGDQMIQKLADRLAAVDLLPRATQLLEHQIRYRVAGEERARVGARLALLYLLNKEPQRALEVLEITNFGQMGSDLMRQRMQLTAKALAGTDRAQEALSMLAQDASREGALLRLDILWGMQDWPNVISAAEDILAQRTSLTQPMSDREMQVLLKLALAYSFEEEPTQLAYLRDYYMTIMPESPYRDVFEYITNDTNPLDADDTKLVAAQISRTESFLDLFRKEIAQGRLSDVAAEPKKAP